MPRRGRSRWEAWRGTASRSTGPKEREGEALALTWADLDLERGAVRLDRNKTDDPRAWALADGTTDALRTYRQAQRASAQSSDPVFLDAQGRPHSKFGLAMLLRSHLEAAGLMKTRPELFETTAQRQRIRVHDLARELEARRRARVAPEVADIEAARVKRGGS